MNKKRRAGAYANCFVKRNHESKVIEPARSPDAPTATRAPDAPAPALRMRDLAAKKEGT